MKTCKEFSTKMATEQMYQDAKKFHVLFQIMTLDELKSISIRLINQMLAYDQSDETKELQEYARNVFDKITDKKDMLQPLSEFVVGIIDKHLLFVNKFCDVCKAKYITLPDK